MSLLDGFQDALKSKAADQTQDFLSGYLDDELAQFGIEVGVDSVFNSIPLIGTSIVTYRNKKQMKNFIKLIGTLNQKINDIQNMLSMKESLDREKIDDIVNIAINKALRSEQLDKIEFIVHGLESILKNDDISFDVASLYFDTIDRLTLLDIAVIKFYRFPFNIETGEARDIQKLLETFNITLDIFQATKSNLRTSGLLETKTDKKLSDDLSNIYDTLSQLSEKMNKLTEAFKNPKKASSIKSRSIKTKRLQSKEVFQISKFGRDFHDYFLGENPYT